MDVDFVRDCFEKQNKDFEAACDEMMEHRDRLESAQLKTAKDLEELWKEYEQDKSEQAKKEQANKIYNLVMMLIAVASMIIALVK